MSRVSLREFRRVSGISSGTVIRLLEDNVLPCYYSAEDGLMIELDQLDLEDLLKELASLGASRELSSELVETASLVVRQEIDVIVEEVLSRLEEDQGR